MVPGNTIHVAFCVDRAMLKPAAAAALSLARHRLSRVHVHACVGPDEEAAAAMTQLLSQCGLAFDVNTAAPDAAHALPFISPYGKGSTAAYRRIFLAELYPACGRMIYLDADVMVRRPVDTLWQTDLEGCHTGAVTDPWWISKPARAALFPGGYFNSGVLLMDLAAWRKQKIAERIADYVRAWRSGNRIGLEGDASQLTDIWGFQTEMNAALAGRWTTLSPEWNASLFHLRERLSEDACKSPALARAREDPAIVHFMGHEKPWETAFAGLSRHHVEYQAYRDEVDRLLPGVAWPGVYAVGTDARRHRRALALKLVARAGARGVRRACVFGSLLVAADVIALAREAGIAIDGVVSNDGRGLMSVSGVEVLSLDDALARGHHTFILGFDGGIDKLLREISETSERHGVLPAFVSADASLAGGPRKIRVEATSHCQLRCPACPTASGAIDKAIGRGMLDPAAFETLLAENPQIREVELSNYGEAVLHPALVEILAIAARRGVGVSLENGVNFNNVRPEVLKALVQSGVRSVRLSIDGASQETYAQYRRGGDFAAVMRNLLTLVALKRNTASALPRLTWQFIIFEHNRHEVERARRMALGLGMRFVTKLAWNAGLAPPGRDRAAHLQANGTLYLGEICEQLWESPQINWNGDMLGCCRNFWSSFGGNAFTQGLADAVNGEGLRRARRALKGLQEADAESPCKSCEIYQWRRDAGRWINRSRDQE